ncbi:hypothetical protein AVEN_69538-1 [Araneus ventricosus]|uniref:Uncharacterized protein n=1 Tax=Araneus ventricosus TaxID=182803 RepID=A0A4Y2RPY7_ARAVE|nr:hypothetical protein AVEN_69538-1 [Araneus ventricosus]
MKFCTLAYSQCQYSILIFSEPNYKVCPNEKETTVICKEIDIDTLIPVRRKGVDGFSVETGVRQTKHQFSPSSDSLTLLGHPLCTNFAITKLFVDYVMHNSLAYR